MKQARIMALLIEASLLARQTEQNARRLNEIQVELASAVYDNHEGQNRLNSRAAGLRTCLNKLYVTTLTNDPSKLPGLFPAFAILCGERDGTIIADPDWEIMRAMKDIVE